MIPLPLPPKVIQKKKNQAVFEIEGLYPGYGVTIGNSLRRVLLSSLQGAAVTEVKIKGVPHEFSTIPGVLEDVIMILLNIKNLRFKIFEGDTYKIEMKAKGEGPVIGKEFKCPPQVKLVNPDLQIATITDKKTELEIALTIQKGIGYVPKDQAKRGKAEIGAIAIDAIYTPIKNVNFSVENMRVGDRTDFDKLSLEIETDGTITPEESFFEACDILIKHFNIIFEGKAGKEEKKEKSEEKEEKTEEDVTKLLVEDLKLTGRTLNALLNNGIKTVGGIAKKSEKSLSELEGMGEKALSEVKRKIKKLGLELKEE
ncbi:MAG: DNA-directed RNA polymerase subunit alpha [Candidatus Staskawiczbacteria bacterium]|nr:DNA-directed RNA polymerase subunit alpha [Candidatus Staskawiczbacteria bacterium]